MHMNVGWSRLSEDLREMFAKPQFFVSLDVAVLQILATTTTRVVTYSLATSAQHMSSRSRWMPYTFKKSNILLLGNAKPKTSNFALCYTFWHQFFLFVNSYHVTLTTDVASTFYKHVSDVAFGFSTEFKGFPKSSPCFCFMKIAKNSFIDSIQWRKYAKCNSKIRLPKF